MICFRYRHNSCATGSRSPVQVFQQLQVGLQILQGTLLQKLFEVFVKMAVVVIAILRVVKGFGVIGHMGGGFADAHDLQGAFTVDAGGFLKIALQGAGRYFVLLRPCFNRCSKIIIAETMVEDLCYDVHFLQGTGVLVDNGLVIGGNDLHPFFKGGSGFDSIDQGLVYQVAKREDVFAVLRKVYFLLK